MAGWASHAAGAVPGTRLVVFPGEGTNAIGATVGHIYVMVAGVLKQTYPVAGGPPPGHGRKGEEGGHSAGATPPGLYVLGYKEHHTTQNWPSSVVPFGAVLRENEGVIEYQLAGVWRQAFGPRGTVTQSWLRWYQRSHVSCSVERADREAYAMFFVRGRLTTPWIFNDFGQWSWNMTKRGHRKVYLHTTPRDEMTYDSPVALQQSHGSLHIRPRDRNQMEGQGYLKSGRELQVMPYSQHGSPKGSHP